MRVPLAVGACSVAFVVACADILGVEPLTRGDRDAGPLSDTYVPPDTSPDPCLFDPGPARPSATDGTSLAPFWVAASAMAFDKVDLNLDNACTVDVPSSRCVLQKLKDSYQLDQTGRYGVPDVDFGMRELLADSVAGVKISDALSAAVTAGLWTVAFRVSDYDGGTDDPAVTLQLASVTTSGNQGWLVEPESVDGGVNQGASSSRAWVAGGKLVAFFDEPVALPVRVSKGAAVPFNMAVNMTLHSVIVTAEVANEGGTPTLQNGVFGGRLRVTDAVQQFGSVAQNSACLLLTSTYCSNAADVALERSQDGTKLECNAVSGQFGFGTQPISAPALRTNAPPFPPPTCSCP